MQHVHLESADQVDKKPYPASRDGVSTRNAVGVALDSEMHDAATTTTQAVTHPSSDLVLEVHQLPSPPHNIGTASHPTTTSSASSSSLLPAPSLQLSHDDAASTPGTGQQEQAGVTVAVHDSTELDCVVALDVDAKGNGNGRNSGMTGSDFLPAYYCFFPRLIGGSSLRSTTKITVALALCNIPFSTSPFFYEPSHSSRG